MKLTILITISFALAWVLCYGALRTAERIAANQQNQIESIIEP